MRTFRPAASLILLVIGLSACSSDGGDGTPSTIGPIYCAALTGGTASAGAVCAGGTCSQNFSDAAADRDLDTYAILEMVDGASGNVRIRVTAQDGVTYPAGTPAAVVYGIARSAGDSLNTTETITTYLDGTLQETGPVNAANGTTSGDVDAGRRSITTSMPFDALEFTYAQTSGTADVQVHVHEFCTSVN
jgi:hypothetical protein